MAPNERGSSGGNGGAAATLGCPQGRSLKGPLRLWSLCFLPLPGPAYREDELDLGHFFRKVASVDVPAGARLRALSGDHSLWKYHVTHALRSVRRTGLAAGESETVYVGAARPVGTGGLIIKQSVTVVRHWLESLCSQRQLDCPLWNLAGSTSQGVESAAGAETGGAAQAWFGREAGWSVKSRERWRFGNGEPTPSIVWKRRQDSRRPFKLVALQFMLFTSWIRLKDATVSKKNSGEWY